MKRILIFANGDLPDLEKARALLRPDDFILCADGGTRHALALDVKPNLILGDMDSIEKDHIHQLQQTGVEIELFPPDKDETDLELAIHKALELNPEKILIVAALGGRLDQTLANLALLASSLHASRNVRLDDGVEEILFCRDQVQIEGRRGDIASLIPWGEPVHGVQTENLKWRLENETLYPDKTRGISNEMLSDSATIKIASGLLLVIHSRKSSTKNHKS